MELLPVLDYNWGLMAPELIVLAVAALTTVLDLVLGRGVDRRLLGWISLGGVLLALAALIANLGQPPQEILAETYRYDAFANAFKVLILAATALSLVMAMDYRRTGSIEAESEFYYLYLSAALGAMIMVSSADLITLVIGLETLSVSSYIMAGLRKKNRRSNEGAFKYVVYGGAASATLLYGISFVYGLTGTTHIGTAAQRLAEAYESGFSGLLLIALVLMIAGFGYKISAAPFHMWAPDVYQGSSTPVVSFLSVASKTAGIAMMIRVLFLLTYSAIISDMLLTLGHAVTVLAILSMLAGSLMALRQTNLKRLVAYSGVAQAGYLLVPFSGLNTLMFDQTVFFLTAYLLMNIGFLVVIQILGGQEEREDLSLFAGLGQRNPWLALATVIFVLSLAGFPVTAGFFAKYYLFIGALSVGQYLLAAAMVISTVIAYVFYFGILRQVYWRQPEQGARVQVPWLLGILVAILAVGTLALGFFPSLALETIVEYFPILDDIFTQADPAA